MTEERKVLAKMIDRACHMMAFVSEYYEGQKARESVIRWRDTGLCALQLWCSAYDYDLLDFETKLKCLDSTRDAMLSKINHKDESRND